jgi:hypothetical protein
MDRITKQLLSDFLKSQELEGTNDAEDFERFCNFSVISNEYNKTFNIDQTTIGAGNDTGIDGIAIIVNGHLVEESDEINDILKNNGYLDVTYIFTQAKTSSSLDTKEMHGFYFGVSDFFSEDHKLPRNEDVIKYNEISEAILNNAPYFKANPKCKTFYITTGSINHDDENMLAATKAAHDNLNSYNLFESVEVNVLGANELGKLYRKSKSPITSTFSFINKITLPEIDGVDQSYYGVLPFAEFKKILIDENGNIQSIFDDNVRDFQGNNNPVNKSISETLSCENSSLFSVLNNGVTIVANSIKTSGNTFTITDFQIVNGCQTSNVLYENRHLESINNIVIPLRIIVTNDEDIKSKVTVSTNNQTAIKKEQLSAMSDFQKNLEHYYSSIDGDGKLYYERRAKQYNSDRDIVKKRIITVPNQIKSFSSMFNKNPHLVTSYFGELVKNIGEKGSRIFEHDHQYAPYYVASLSLYRLENLFNSGDIDKKYRKVRFYLIMLVPLIASTSEMPPLNSQKKAEKFCDPIMQKLNDDYICKKIFSTATSIIENSGTAIEDKAAVKSKQMTDQILKSYKNEKV